MRCLHKDCLNSVIFGEVFYQNKLEHQSKHNYKAKMQKNISQIIAMSNFHNHFEIEFTMKLNAVGCFYGMKIIPP